MITKTAPINFIMMFSPAASSLATRVGGGGGPFPEKYRYWYWASLPGGRSQPWLTWAAAGVFHLNVYDLVVLANTDFGIFASPSPSPGGRVTLNDVTVWCCDVELLRAMQLVYRHNYLADYSGCRPLALVRSRSAWMMLHCICTAHPIHSLSQIICIFYNLFFIKYFSILDFATTLHTELSWHHISTLNTTPVPPPVTPGCFVYLGWWWQHRANSAVPLWADTLYNTLSGQPCKENMRLC